MLIQGYSHSSSNGDRSVNDDGGRMRISRECQIKRKRDEESEGYFEIKKEETKQEEKRKEEKRKLF